MRSIFVALATAAALAWPAAAHASPDYPGAVATHLSLPSAPACTLCHADMSGGKGTVTKPFGVSMRAHGLVSGSEPSLFAALDSMAADKTDSICDGTPDIDDLKAGRDPNASDSDAGAGACGSPAGEAIAPEYGCIGRVAPARTSSGEGAVALVALAAAIGLARRSRRRSPGRPRPHVGG